jgi:hypothetical protein
MSELRAHALDEHVIIDALAALAPPRFLLFDPAAHLLAGASREFAGVHAGRAAGVHYLVADQCPSTRTAARIEQVHQSRAGDRTEDEHADTAKIDRSSR